ncbi:hypothetical protein ALC60_10129, partial [Trachymyrmex zeteki]
YYANARDYRIQIALYVSLRSATNQEMLVLDHHAARICVSTYR